MNDEWHIFPLIIVHLRDSVITGRLQGHQSLQASVVYTLRVVGITINLYTDSLFKQYREVAFIRIESTQFQIRFCINLYDISFSGNSIKIFLNQSIIPRLIQ